MLQMISTGPSPVLARMGQLQRLFMQQAAMADAWAVGRELGRIEKEKQAALAPPAAPAAVAAAPAASAEAEAAAAAAPAAEGAAVAAPAAPAAAPTAAAAGSEEEAGEEAAAAGDIDMAAEPVAAEGGAPMAPGASIHARPIRKKTPEEISHDIIHHSVSMLRGFFVAVAKSIHAPARRRDDPAVSNPAQPKLGARAAALALAVLLKVCGKCGVGGGFVHGSAVCGRNGQRRVEGIF